ncbi:hypothetical protein EA462_06640 [Natrarchaeobius halalkaliphilus]|uniref:Halobacterial output domain-containing protein n=1 Tax=Natrarchaeobius halalkaliphilus TaxID=1679091 RepID=A0A3N6N108_9EURY|nr:HalOD1 output domain-containing protein [Natrarchaeobius halalkaliphilus]RQG91622.1 hypothetical protein EA462_06640 [Natrarchaeobius halalkaliphilus]
MGHGESISVTITRAVAAYDGVRPTELDPPLYDAIDTDALNALFRPSDNATDNRSISLEFRYEDYTIRVAGPDDIEIELANATPESTETR